MDFQGKTAIVTGASRGIGRAISLELARRGCNIAFNYRENTAKAEEMGKAVQAAGRDVYLCKLRVEDYDSAENMVRQVVSRFGSVDYLVNNAGIVRDRLILRMNEKDWDEVLDTNLKGAFNFSKAVAPVMVKAR
ncbi:MAG TPA: SDR family NAD(P)-dependent oxidoreductase, partial [Acidobacteriota bacterium]|nr:SDR family NAD(P)-dependent oxidoreductase [Acidobacteriota bacterium]